VVAVVCGVTGPRFAALFGHSPSVMVGRCGCFERAQLIAAALSSFVHLVSNIDPVVSASAAMTGVTKHVQSLAGDACDVLSARCLELRMAEVSDGQSASRTSEEAIASTIRVCKSVEDAIRSVSDAECLLARGVSLVHKFPRSLALVLVLCL
jgi:hypothetical protein